MIGGLSLKNHLKEFDYLTKMSLATLSVERVRKMEKKLADLETDLADLLRTDIKQMWKNDIEDFLAELDKLEKREAAKLNKADKKRKKKKPRKLKAKPKPRAKPRAKKDKGSVDSNMYKGVEKNKKKGRRKNVKANPLKK